MPFLLPIIFIFWRGLDFLVSFFSGRFVHYLGFFAYPNDIRAFSLPSWLYSFANFDGAYYIRIARMGYHQYEQAFFPLYPLLIKALSPVFLNNQLIAGLVISNVSFFIGLLLLKKLTSNFFWTILFLFSFPTSFFFTSLYTEGLFFFFTILFFYLIFKKNPLLAGVIGFLAALTRLTGILLIIPLFVALFFNRKHPNPLYLVRNAIICLLPLLGLGLYSFYLYKTTGDPLFFFNSQPIFGANRSTHLILFPQVAFRYLKILFTAKPNFQYFIAFFEFSLFTLVFSVLAYDLIRLVKNKLFSSIRFSLNLFSFANLLLPTLTGTFSSIPRYALLSISFFIVLAEIQNRALKIIVFLVFLIVHIVILAYFIQGYFVA